MPQGLLGPVLFTIFYQQLISSPDQIRHCYTISAKLSQWHDKDSSTSKGISVESITLQSGLHQIINKPTHILEN